MESRKDGPFAGVFGLRDDDVHSDLMLANFLVGGLDEVKPGQFLVGELGHGHDSYGDSKSWE